MLMHAKHGQALAFSASCCGCAAEQERLSLAHIGTQAHSDREGGQCWPWFQGCQVRLDLHPAAITSAAELTQASDSQSESRSHQVVFCSRQKGEAWLTLTVEGYDPLAIQGVILACTVCGQPHSKIAGH